MPVLKGQMLVKSILTSFAFTGMVKSAINGKFKDYTTVFLFYRAAGIYEGFNGRKPEELEQLLIYIKK